MKQYETTDLYLGSYLKARGLTLADTRRDGRRVTFVFHDDPRRAQLVRDFYNDGTVRICEFRHALEDLRAVVYNY